MRTLDRKSDKNNQPKTDPLITQTKYNELKNKLEKLKKTRPWLASEVARLAELGDFSENVEYQLAKGRLRGLNNNMLKLENQLRQAVIISTPKQTGTVQIGHTVTIVSIVSGAKKKKYQILGSSETNPQQGIISHNSPIGAALLGHKVGDAVKLKLADKEVEYIIMNIA